MTLRRSVPGTSTHPRRWLTVGVAALSLVALSLAASGRGGMAMTTSRSLGVTSPGHTGPSAALGKCPPSEPVASLAVFARTDLGLTPDDLWVDATGDVWVTVTAQGHILDFTANGALRQNLPDPNGPEGIIVTAAGSVVADQTVSRVDRLEADGHLTPFLKLPNRHQRLPVDGLGFDVQRQRLLIPNSPEGTLLTTPLTMASPHLLATGLGRPVAAAVGPDGSIYVAAESNVGLVRIPTNGGRAKRVGTLSNLDEVVSVGGLLYTTGAGDKTVRVVDPSTGDNQVLATGGHELQGLAPLPDGRLLVIDSTAHTISFVTPCQ